MPPVAMVGLSTVNGGVIIGPGALMDFTDDLPTSVVGDHVAPHEPFTGEHLIATIAIGSSSVFAEDLPITYEGSLATCGHFVDGDCSLDRFVGI